MNILPDYATHLLIRDPASNAYRDRLTALKIRFGYTDKNKYYLLITMTTIALEDETINDQLLDATIGLFCCKDYYESNINHNEYYCKTKTVKVETCIHECSFTSLAQLNELYKQCNEAEKEYGKRSLYDIPAELKRAIDEHYS